MPSFLLRLLVLLLALAASGGSRAESENPVYLTRSWGTRDGLPQDSVVAMARTPDGYLWLGSSGGLARFDGVNFTTYGLADGLKGVSISSFADDGDGGLWIGTTGGGLSRWHHGAITTLTTAGGLAHNDVMALAPAEAGAVWIGTKAGLQHYGKQGFTTVGQEQGLNRESAALIADGHGGVWASFYVTGLFHCSLDHCEKIPGPPGIEDFLGHSLLVDHRGDLWVSIGNGMLLRRHAGQWRTYPPADGVPTTLSYGLAEGAPGEIWLATSGEGMWVLRENQPIRKVPGLPETLLSILPGANGQVWVGTAAEGLWKLTAPKLDYLPVSASNRRGRVGILLEEPPGTFWITTYGGGIFSGPLDRLEPVIVPTELDGHRHFYPAIRMHDGTLVFGGPRVLLERSPTTGLISGFNIPDNITALLESSNGSLLIGTREGTLKRRNGDGFEEIPGGSFPAAIPALAPGPGNSVWIATQGAGLYRWDAGITEHWGTGQGLPTEALTSLYPDPDGTLWMGTSGGGLAWLKDGRLHTADRRHGMNEDSVKQIHDDHQGNLWLGGLRGIQRVSKKELHGLAAGRTDVVHPLVLDQSDGMMDVTCSAAPSPPDQRYPTEFLRFPTEHGVVILDPSRFRSTGNPPKVLIESMAINSVEQDLHQGAIRIPAATREVEIRYTAFSDSKPDQQRFRYRMGNRGNWIESHDQRSIRFSQLPPGEHEFQVAAANPDGRWNPDPATLAFTVLPSIWQTAWFKLATLAAAIALVWHWLRQQNRRATERERLLTAEADAHRHLSELTHMNRVSTLGGLATTLAHELNQPLAAIHCNAESAKIFLNKPLPDLVEIAEIISDIGADGHRASEVILRMRSMLQRHPFEIKTIEVPLLIEKVAGLLKPLLQSRDARLTLEISPDLPPVSGDSVHLQQLLMNLILNALEAMSDNPPATREVLLKAVRNAPRSVSFSVIDQGPGLPASKLAKIDEPFVTTKKDGMGMGLTICCSIVAAHGGMLSAENPPSGGAIISFTLPAEPGNH